MVTASLPRDDCCDTRLKARCAWSGLLLVGMLAWAGLAPRHSQAHELQSNRATLVLREGQQLALTLYINYLDALHKIIAPSQPFEAFLMSHAAMPPAVFAQSVTKAHAQLEANTQLTLPGQKRTALVNWRWPDAAQTQAGLQQRSMQMVVGDNAAGKHLHEEPTVVQADAKAAAGASAVTVTLPAVMQPVLLVAYRSSQVWMDVKNSTKTVRF